MHRILIADDETKITDMIRTFLEKEGFTVHTAHDGMDALESVKRFHPHLVVLDVMMPRMNGFDFMRELRKSSPIPVIMLTARSEELDTLLGLEMGADDYMSKPFSLRELSARIRVVLRRFQKTEEADATIRVGELCINRVTMEVFYQDQPIPVLTPTEFKLLEAMAGYPGRVFTRMQLLEIVGEGYAGYDRTLDTHVSNLRKKLLSQMSTDIIQTVYGVGYKIGKGGDGG